MLAIKKNSITIRVIFAVLTAMSILFAPNLVDYSNRARWCALYEEGDRAITAHDYEKGIRLWSQILREMPSTGTDALSYADIAIQLERFLPPDYPFMSKRANPEKERLLRTASEIYARELGELNSDTLHARDQLAFYLRSQNRDEEASSLIRQSIAACQKSGKQSAAEYGLHRHLSLILTEQKRYLEATDESEKMLALARSLKNSGAFLSISLNFLGCDYIRSKQFEKAVTVLTEAIDIDKGSDIGQAIPLCNLARAYEGMGRYSDAIATCQKALILLHKSNSNEWKTVETELQLALVYNKAKQYSNAVTLLHHVIKFSKDKASKKNLEHYEYDKAILIKDCNLYLIPAQAALLESHKHLSR